MSLTAAAQPANRTRELVTAALIAALAAGTAWISIPFGPVPVTLQTTFVLLAGLLLSPLYAGASMALYLALGAIGLPVFAGGQGGLSALLGPTGGFLWAFPVAAIAVSLTCGALRPVDEEVMPWVAKAGVAALVGEVVIYAIGVPWLMIQANLTLAQTLGAAFAPFIIPDVIKALVAVVVARALERALSR